MLSCRRFLYLLPPGVGEREAEKLEQEVPEFQIDELFEVIHHMSYECDPRRKGSSSLLTAQHSFSQELGKTLEDKPGSLCNYVKNLEKYTRARKIKNIPVPVDK